ncbi:MAG: UDP-N-acetylmuramoyl-L-alanyl-D-glutamate--2,6-diaminopimelate ligase [Clostridiales bacterium]|nr:UDP-N-acetylmuramoyl-L-alanyl-D-glutamate--2,6-diaminopimelate ligase [Clostridiales bacterium]
MRLSKLLEAIGNGKMIFDGDWEREIAVLSADSRKEQISGLFFCLKGEQTDSHTCVDEAIKNGAVAIVTERELSVSVPQILVADTRYALGRLSSVFYEEPSSHLKVIGVTGTNGKTTTSYMVASILREEGKNVGIIGTLGVFYNQVARPSDLTTPDPIALHATLAEMYRHGVEYVVMEVSAHALYYKKTVGVAFTACLFTNFTQDHLDFFGTMQAYKQAKKLLFSEDMCPLAILNGDEDLGREIGLDRDKIKALKTVYYGLHTPSDSFAVITEESLKGTECVLNLSDKLCRVSLSMMGKHNVYNALAASVCAKCLGCSLQSIAIGLKSVNTVEGRLQSVGSFHGADIFVDFAHTPDGLGKSLDALRLHCKGRLICLFGCGGNRDKGKRLLMGEIAAKKADFSVLTSDNPRYEDPLDIISGIEKGYRRFSVYYVVVPDRKRAIEYALEFLKKGDILLVAGKGGEQYQEIMGIKYPFNDHDIIKEKLRKTEKFSG